MVWYGIGLGDVQDPLAAPAPVIRRPGNRVHSPDHQQDHWGPVGWGGGGLILTLEAQAQSASFIDCGRCGVGEEGGGGGSAGPPPPPRVPLWSPPKAGQKILKLKSSWHRRR